MIESELDLAKKHVSSSVIRKFRSSAKKAYKLALCGMFADLLHTGRFSNGPFWGDVYTMYINLEIDPRLNNNVDMITSRLRDDLSNYYFHSLDDDSVNEIIAFFRNIIKNIEDKNKRLYLVSEVQKIYDIKREYKESQYITLNDHHWFDFGFDVSHSTATYHEFFNYFDLIKLWNDYVSKYKQYEQLIVTRDNNNEIRRLHYSLNSSSRFLVISSIIFVESYLYYLFYSIKNNNTYSNDDRVKGILNRRGYIQDTQIVEDIIFKLFEEVENNQFIKKKYDLYEQSIELRNRLVHTSAFVDESNNLSQL